MQDKKLTPEEIRKKMEERQKHDSDAMEDFRNILEYSKSHFFKSTREFRDQVEKQFDDILSNLKSQKTKPNRVISNAFKEFTTSNQYFIFTDTVKISQIANNDIVKEYYEIIIVARNELIVDHDLDAYNLFLVSPIWTIQSNHVINLSGNDGKSSDNEIYPWSWVRKEAYYGQEGRPGGFFFGFGYQFQNINNLKILSNGGNGGNGQSTADAPDAKDRHFDLKRMFSENKEVSTKHSLSGEISQLMQLFIDETGEYGRNMELKLNRQNIMGHYNNAWVSVKLHPEDGKQANTPGKEGEGGHPGSILIINVDSDKEETNYQKEQKSGQSGKPGKKGKDGQNGNGEVLEDFKIYFDKDKWVCRIDKDQNPHPTEIRRH